MTQITDLPTAIASIQYEMLSLDDQINPVRDELTELDSEFDAIVAFDTELKNDVQRKARRSELQCKHSWYQELTTTLKELTRHKQQLSIELELRRNQFAVAKLESRKAIASLETMAVV